MSRPSFGELGGQDPYEILELSSGASEAEVRAARKRLLRRYHPDLPTGDLRRTQMITAAADLLLDPLRRIGYYDLRDEESRRIVFTTGDEPAATATDDREATPSSGTRTDGHWFRPLDGFDGRPPRSSPGRDWTASRRVPGSRRSSAPTGRRATQPSHRHDEAKAAEAAKESGSWPEGPGTAGMTGTTVPPPPTVPPFPTVPLFSVAGTAGGRSAETTQGIKPTFVTPPSHREQPPDPSDRVEPGTATNGSTRRYGARAETAAAETAGATKLNRGRERTGRIRRRRAGSEYWNRGQHAAPEQVSAVSRWNALAIASVVAILTWTPLPLVLGLLALSQIRRFGQRGTRLALIGVVVGAVFLVVYLYILFVSR